MTEIHGHQPTALLVDDEPMVTQALALFLELESDYAVITCGSGAEALEQLADGPVDVVVSDFLMPGMNGVLFKGLPHSGLVTGQGELQFQSAAGLLLGLVDGPMYTPG